MKSLRDAFAAKHGVLRRQDLHALGLDDARILRGTRSGHLIRIRQGWYKHAEVPLHPIVETAVKQGCALSGPSALAMQGAWHFDDGRVYLRASRQHHNRGPSTVTVLRSTKNRYVPVTAAVDPVPVAFEVALTKAPEHDFIIVADSLVRRDLLSIDEMDAIAARYARHLRARVERVNGVADSGTETAVRLWLEDQQLPYIQQFVWSDRRERADFLVGSSLIIEVDSLAHHGSREDQQQDYARDQLLQELGYVVFRVTYSDVMHNWPTVSKRLLALIARGEHLRRPVGAR